MIEDRKTLVSAGWAGIVFVVLLLVSAFIGGAPPDPDAAAGEVRDFLADSGTRLLWGALIGLLGTLPAVWFVAVLTQHMRRATGDWVLPIITIIGLVLAAAMAWAATAMTGALVWSDGLIGAASDELVLYGWNAASILYASGGAGFAVFLGAAAWAILRTNLMPAAVGWVAVVGAVLSVVGMFGILDAGLGMLAFLGFLSWSAWIVVAGIMMITGKVTTAMPSPSRPAEPAAPIS